MIILGDQSEPMRIKSASSNHFVGLLAARDATEASQAPIECLKGASPFFGSRIFKLQPYEFCSFLRSSFGMFSNFDFLLPVFFCSHRFIVQHI